MANLPIFNSDNKDLMLMQTSWKSVINPLLSNPVNQVFVIKDIKLITGNNTINHLQGRALNGYVVLRMKDAFAQIYEVDSPLPKLTIVLNASADTTINLGVF